MLALYGTWMGSYRTRRGGGVDIDHSEPGNRLHGSIMVFVFYIRERRELLIRAVGQKGTGDILAIVIANTSTSA